MSTAQNPDRGTTVDTASDNRPALSERQGSAARRSLAGADSSERGARNPQGNLPLAALCLGYVMIVLDATIVNTALPDIGRDLSAAVNGLQWVTAGYTLVFACLLLSAGSLGDRVGPRRVFVAGIAVFTIASAACGLAPNLWMLVTARVVQGVGAATALPTSLALINAAYSDRSARARAIGIWGGLSGIAAGLGPVLGGILTQCIGWRSIFAINIPVGIAAIALTLRYVTPPPRRAPGRSLDIGGQVSSIIAVAALAYGLIQANQLGWGAPAIVTALAVAGTGAVAWVVIEKFTRHPMLPLALFADRRFTGAVLAGAAINLGFYGELFLLALYFQDSRHYSPLLAGLAMLPQPGIASIGSALGGGHTARFGPRPVMLIGLMVGALGLFALTQTTTATPYWMLIAPLFAVGFGTAYTMPAATTTTMESAPPDLAGTASGALNASRQIGSTLGVAIFGTLVAASGTFSDGFRLSAFVGGCVFMAGAVVTFLAIRPLKDSATAAEPKAAPHSATFADTSTQHTST